MPKIMGILNITPDSFFDGGLYLDPARALEHALTMQQQGADIIDVGAESTRPGATPVTSKEELLRVLPLVRLLVEHLKAEISIDTYKPKVAEECLKLGAHIINDVTGLTNPKMREVVAKYNCPAIIMHQGPGTFKAIQDFFIQQAIAATKDGIEHLIFDPGFGFGKTPQQNWQILNNLDICKVTGYPLLIGTSRKSFYDGRKKYTTLTTLKIGIEQGVDILRVHDVGLAYRALHPN